MEKDNMTRWELLTMLLSLKALLESDNKEKALEVIEQVITEAKRNQQYLEAVERSTAFLFGNTLIFYNINILML